MNWNGSRSFPKYEEKNSIGLICLLLATEDCIDLA